MPVTGVQTCALPIYYNLKLDDITARCGYHDTPYFCHVFKKVSKSTPMEFRLNTRRNSPALKIAGEDDEPV